MILTCKNKSGFQFSNPLLSRHLMKGDGNVVMFTSLSLILLAFFILLYALSSPKKEQEQKELALQIEKAFSSFGGQFLFGDNAESGTGRVRPDFQVGVELEDALSELEGYLEENPTLQNFAYEIFAEGVKLHIPTGFVFEPDSIAIDQKAESFLDKVFEMIARTENQVRIEGHTDSLPVKKFYDSWELSALRATSILRFFQSKQEVSLNRFSAAGYGGTQPIASNRISAGRAKNRRVTIVLIGKVELLGGTLGTGN